MKMDKRVKWLTAIVLSLVCCCFSYFYWRSTASYLPAWFSILIIALLALVVLSIPRFINITQNSLEVHCIMELTTIPIHNIKSITPISRAELKWCIPIPLLGIWGVFGYYGYYFDLKNMKVFKLFASQWNNFIRIEDIFEEVIVVSNPNRDKIIEMIKMKKGR